jgi:hypothetical protein
MKNIPKDEELPKKASVLRREPQDARQPSPRTAFTTDRESRGILAFRPHHFGNISYWLGGQQIHHWGRIIFLVVNGLQPETRKRQDHLIIC